MTSSLYDSKNSHRAPIWTTIVIIVLFGSIQLSAQFAFPSLSPKGKISQVVGNTLVEIEYERPSARNRAIFGHLVPWNMVWRTGAGYCTKISFDQPVHIGGQTVEAGKYSIFTIPNTDEWVIILNTDTTLYGSYNYDTQHDIARFIARPQKSHRYYETLTFDIDLRPNNATIYISWENTQVSFELKTSTDSELMNYIEENLLSGKLKDGNLYSNAAEHLYFLNTRLKDALLLTDMAIELNQEDGFARRVQMDIYEKLHLYEDALLTIEEALRFKNSSTDVDAWIKHQNRIKEKISDRGH